MNGARRSEDGNSAPEDRATSDVGAAVASPHISSADPQSADTRPRASYRVHLDLFEGPLDLLLHLIKKDEFDIADIPIARIIEQYLGYLDLMLELNLEVAGEFLVMAATLTLIKSRMLLPSAEPDEEEEADPRANLIRQLLEYQRFREAAEALAERPRLHREVFTRPPGVEGLDPATEDGPPRVRATVWDLLEAFRAILGRTRPEAVHEVAAEPVTLRECIDSLLRTLSVARSVTFDSLFDDGASRVRILATFLALLELMKLGAVEAVQEERFGPIVIILAVDDVSAVTVGLVDDYGEASDPDDKPDSSVENSG
jgi:segregation and condensation protein A